MTNTKQKIEADSFQSIRQEAVTALNRYFDALDYRRPGSKPVDRAAAFKGAEIILESSPGG